MNGYEFTIWWWLCEFISDLCGTLEVEKWCGYFILQRSFPLETRRPVWFLLQCFMHDCSLWADSEEMTRVSEAELFKSDEDECAEHFRNVSALSCGLKAGFYLFIRSTIFWAAPVQPAPTETSESWLTVNHRLANGESVELSRYGGTVCRI